MALGEAAAPGTAPPPPAHHEKHLGHHLSSNETPKSGEKHVAGVAARETQLLSCESGLTAVGGDLRRKKL